MKGMKWLVASALVAIVGSSASASTIAFDFTGAGSNVTSLVKTNGGTTITATPIAQSEGLFTVNNAFLTQNATGLGVTWSGTFLGFIPVSDTDPTQVDNFGPNEAINFTLNGVRTLESVTFHTENLLGQPPFTEDFALLVDGNPVALGSLSVINSPGLTGTFTVSLDSLPFDVRTGTNFLIRPLGGGSDFQIAALDFRPIPEPATLAVFGLMAIGGAGYARRKLKLARVA